MSSSLKRSWSDRSCQTRIQKCWFPVRVYWDTGRLGMKLVEQDGVLVVRRTQKGTWADEMKLRIGDELVSINGQAVSQMREEDCRETLLWRRPLRLTFARLCRASATPRLRNRMSERLNEALSYSQAQLQDIPSAEQVVRSRAESLEVRADEVGEDKAVVAVVTALLDVLQDPGENQENDHAKVDDAAELPRELRDESEVPKVDLLPGPKAKDLREEDLQVAHSEEPTPGELSEASKPSPLSRQLETSEPTLPDVGQRERQYSDFEEDCEEYDEPPEYEDTFEIDDEESMPSTPANKVLSQAETAESQSGYPGATSVPALESTADSEVHPRKVFFADQETTLAGRHEGQEDAYTQANQPASLERKVSFSNDAGPDAVSANKVRKGTGFVAQQDIPESEDEDDEVDDIQAPPGSGKRKVSFSQEAGADSERAQAMRKGTGYVAMRDLPESDEDGDEDIEASPVQPASSERKVSFSEEAGTDSERAKAMRKGTGYVPMSQIARLPSDEDAEEEVDEIRHVSFSPDTATSNSTKASNRKGTGYVQPSELPDDDEEEDEDEVANKRVSFADAQDPAENKTQTSSSTRKGTGHVAMHNLPESEDDDDEVDDIQAPPASGKRKVSFSQEAGTNSESLQAMRKGTGFVPMSQLPDSDEEEDGKVDPADEEETYDDEFEDEDVEEA